MNVIIIYSSKYGCTAACAKYLKAGLSDTVTLTNIDNVNTKTIGLENYDTVILGSSIYVGSISKKMRIFCKENIDLLCRKRVGLFLCCAFPEQLTEYISGNFPPALQKNAVVIKDFGGETNMDKMNAIDKMIMKAVTKGNPKSLKILHENIDRFIKEISM